MHNPSVLIDQTGIGLAGIEGVWWLPAAEPFVLPSQLQGELDEIAHALFALFDVVTILYGTVAGDGCGLNQLLTYKVPPHIPRITAPGHVLAVRPDFQLVPLAHPPYYRLVATELEICPSAQGFAHAMQVGYGLERDLVQAFARLLDGRELLIVGSNQWSEFLFEQLAFCRALAEVGARGRVLYDEPIADIAERVHQRLAWRPPMFGIPEQPPIWHDNVLARIHAHGFEPFLGPDAPDWPEDVGDALVFRFGYFDCFAPERLQRMLDWQECGATFLNPTSFLLDSKVVMATLQLPGVRRHLAADDLATLDRCIPETIVVQPETAGQLRDERETWVVKYAGYDRSNLAWGGRSLEIGALHTSDTWARILDECLTLPWPVVAQRMTPTARIDIAYFDPADQQCWMRNGATRLRSFMLRNPASDLKHDKVTVCGSHVTVSGGAAHVAEGTNAVQAPVVFHD